MERRCLYHLSFSSNLRAVLELLRMRHSCNGLRLLSMVDINADEHQSLLSEGRRQGVDRSPPAESTKLINDLFLGDSKYYCKLMIFSTYGDVARDCLSVLQVSCVRGIDVLTDNAV
jgi:hypothetical protein